MAFVSASLAWSSAELGAAIAGACDGVLILSGLPIFPLEDMQVLFDNYCSGGIADPLHRRFFDFKDVGGGGGDADAKRVLDVRRECIVQMMAGTFNHCVGGDGECDASSEASLPPALRSVLAFWARCVVGIVPAVMSALAHAIGADAAIDLRYSARLVDYYARPSGCRAPRCGAHRDFGCATLIFAAPDASGLQVWSHAARAWRDVPPPPVGAAILLFGVCAALRSNGRIPAVLHRVVDAAPPPPGSCCRTSEGDGGAPVPRRMSAMLFIAPSDGTVLEPVTQMLAQTPAHSHDDDASGFSSVSSLALFHAVRVGDLVSKYGVSQRGEAPPDARSRDADAEAGCRDVTGAISSSRACFATDGLGAGLDHLRI